MNQELLTPDQFIQRLRRITTEITSLLMSDQFNYEFIQNNETEVFENVTVTEPIIINGAAKTALKNIKLSNCKIAKLEINDSFVNEIILTDSTHILELNIINNSWIGSIASFSKSKTEVVSVRNSKIITLLFNQCHLININLISNTHITEFDIKNCIISGDLYLHDCTIKNTFEIINSLCKSVEIGDIIDIDEIRFIKSTVSELYWLSKKAIKVFVNDSIVEHVKFENSVLPKDSVFQLYNCEVNYLTFNSTINFGNIYLKNAKAINHILVWDIELLLIAQWEFGELPANLFKTQSSKFVILNSDLGRTSIIGCKLESFKRFEFYNSKILEIFIAGTNFPLRINVPSELQSNLLDQQRLVFNQYKKIYEAIGNSVTSLEYKAKELEVYRKQLISISKATRCPTITRYFIFILKRRNRNLLKVLKRNKTWNERLNLWFQKFTSNYGTNWWRSLLITKLLLAIGFLFYCVLMGNLPGLNVKVFMHNLSYIGGFLSPVHKNETLETSLMKFEPDSYAVSFARILGDIVRLFLAVMLFQTIQAFRKHGKSSN